MVGIRRMETRGKRFSYVIGSRCGSVGREMLSDSSRISTEFLCGACLKVCAHQPLIQVLLIILVLILFLCPILVTLYVLYGLIDKERSGIPLLTQRVEDRYCSLC